VALLSTRTCEGQASRRSWCAIGHRLHEQPSGIEEVARGWLIDIGHHLEATPPIRCRTTRRRKARKGRLAPTTSRRQRDPPLPADLSVSPYRVPRPTGKSGEPAIRSGNGCGVQGHSWAGTFGWLNLHSPAARSCGIAGRLIERPHTLYNRKPSRERLRVASVPFLLHSNASKRRAA